MKEPLHSGFAKFPNEAKRDEFVEAVLADDASLQSHAHISGSQPTIVFEKLTSDEMQKVHQGLRRRGRWIDDVQFEPMG